MSRIDQIVSIVVVRGREGYEAVARSKDSRLDFIVRGHVSVLVGGQEKSLRW